MPNYYNPYNYFPVTYPGYTQAAYPGQFNNPVPGSIVQNSSYAAGPQEQVEVMKWVEGEVGAKAFQKPAWLPPDTSIPLWDNSEPYIYFKSWNRMGMPNPIQKIKYDPTPVQDENVQKMLPQGQSEAVEPVHMSGESSPYVTKNELEQMKEELKAVIMQSQQHQNNAPQTQSSNNQNENRNSGNRGGNR